MHDVGVIHGRFQMLHLDHLKYLLDGKQRCKHLVIGITNAEPAMIRHEAADPVRGTPLANPLSYFERYQMVKAAMVEAGVAWQAFSIVPLPISDPDRYQHYVPLDAVFFLSIYDDWGRRKQELLESAGLQTCVLRDVAPEEKGISAVNVREKMRRDEPWQHLVPSSVAALAERWQIPDRLRRMADELGRDATPGQAT